MRKKELEANLEKLERLIRTGFIDLEEMIESIGDKINHKKQEEPYQSLQDKKVKAETKKIDLENEMVIGELVKKEDVQKLLSTIKESLLKNFINFGRDNAKEILTVLGIPEKKKELTKILDELIGESLDNIVKEIEKLN